MTSLDSALLHPEHAVTGDVTTLECDFAEADPAPADLTAWDVVIARQGVNTAAFHAVAERARQACHRLFTAREGVPDPGDINFPQRAAPPKAIDTPDDTKSGTTAAIRAIRSTPLFGWLSASLGREPLLKGGRLRFQPPDEVNHALHQDTYFLAGRFFTLWIPAVECGVQCNADAPGLEYLKRKIDWRLDPDPENASRIDPGALAKAVAPDDPAALLLRPRLTLGDALLFRELVPHGGHIPPQTTAAKTSFDFRFLVD